MSSKAVPWFLASTFTIVAGILWLSACSGGKPVVIQPGAFSEDWPTALRAELVENKLCALHRINGKNSHQPTLIFKSGESLSLSGWVFSKKDGALPAVYVQLVGPALTYTALAERRTPRPDVNQYFKLDPTWNTGFELQATQHAEPGKYRIDVLQAGEERVAQCDSGVTIIIN